MKKFLIAILLVLTTILIVPAQEIDIPVDDFADGRPLLANGETWFAMSLQERHSFIAGWLAGHLGLSFMLETTESIKQKYDTEIEWLEMNGSIEALTNMVNMWYITTEAYGMPIFFVLYMVQDKVLWTEEDFERQREGYVEPIPNTL